MEGKEVATSGGVGMSGLLFVALIVLKATGIISMGWFWVITSIIWIPVATFVAIFSLVFGFIAVFAFIGALLSK